ncbi:hypothetical protein B4U79_16837 [Dinothrombium tinctorium]|uniref:Tyrosinase copper-binding domain-containing protein n=1 Tax=Dinothrombium tinctorium TaxID=1965070 RepID=A0A3S3PGP3_9ACAR|nr:hypothetical protein B4U79_16837 [Dinothrombium tinctorium]
MTEDRAGANGNADDDYCIQNGVAAYWERTEPEPGCVRRQYAGQDNIIPAWHSPEFITSILQTSNTFDEFRNRLEYSLHSLMHNNIGGRLGDLTSKGSFNDFVFLLIHSNIDRIWAKWQLADQRNYFAYDGSWLSPDDGVTYPTASLDQEMNPFDILVQDAMAINSTELPITYDEFFTAKPFQENIDAIRRTNSIKIRRRFPKLFESNPEINPMYVDLPPVCSVDEFSGSLVKMTKPRILSNKEITRLNFNIKQMNQVQKESIDFIDFMNSLDYLSAYTRRVKSKRT